MELQFECVRSKEMKRERVINPNTIEAERELNETNQIGGRMKEREK